MAIENKEQYFIYEKYANNSSYNNTFTENINVEWLFSSQYNYIEGIEAINQHNSFCNTKKMTANIIPEKIYKNNIDLYYPYYFNYISEEGLNFRVLLFKIDFEILKKKVKKYGKIPDGDFFANICKYDKLYKSKGHQYVQESELKKREEENIKKIITKCSEPNADPTDPIYEQPIYAKLPLYEYQKKSIKWMIDKELETTQISLEQNEIVLGDYIFDISKKEIVCNNSRDIINISGGALIDEVGLGKTYQTIIMSLCNKSLNKNFIWDGDSSIHGNATLIICPNQLSAQWIKEMELVLDKNYGFKIIPFFTKTHMNKYTYRDILDADFVVTSFPFLGSECFLKTMIEKIGTKKSFFGSKNYSEVAVIKSLDELKKNLFDNLNEKLDCKDPDLLLINWHRIIIDEFHEIHSIEKYSYLRNIIKLFNGKYKWCLTGTPFDKTETSLTEMINFVSNYKCQYVRKMWLNEKLLNYTEKSFFRRNTKKSVEDENKLLPLKETVVWLDFSKTEWMMYNAYKANGMLQEYDVTLRQLCCHPHIVEELKTIISTCSTLEEIEKIMTEHYKKAMISAEKKYQISDLRMKHLENLFTYKKIKCYATILRKKDVKIIFELNSLMNEFKSNFEQYQKLKKTNIENENIEDDNENGNFELKNDIETIKNKTFPINKITINDIETIINYDYKTESNHLETAENIVNDYKKKYSEIKKIYEGKKASFDYYNNVVKRLKTTSNIIKNEGTSSDSDSDDDNKEVCCICFGNITGTDLGVTKCGHIYCFNCIKYHVEKKRDCPVCKRHVGKDEIYMVKKEEEKEEKIEVKDFKDKKTLINLIGTKLANLVFYLRNTKKHAIIFSQWDDLLKKVGETLNEYGIKNVFCKGNVWQRSKTIRQFNTNDDVKVIMLSSESAASGTNLTKAEIVIMLDPVYGSYEYRRNMEWQSIGRAYRTGQKNQVEVVRFIIKNTVEEKIYNENNKDNHLNKIQKIHFDEKKFKETLGEDIKLENGAIKDLIDDVAKLHNEKKTKKKVAKKPKKIEEKLDSDESD